MKRILAHILFVLIPFLVGGFFGVLVGLHHGEQYSDLRGWNTGDTINFVGGGLIPGLIGWILLKAKPIARWWKESDKS